MRSLRHKGVSLMRLSRNRPIAMAVLTTLLAALLTSVVSADCPGTPLVNANFEDGFSAREVGEVEVANGWYPWFQDGPHQDQGLNHRPEWKAENAQWHGTQRIKEGIWAQKWGKVYSTHRAGIYQQVSVPAGSQVTLTGWAQAWSSTEDDPLVSKGGGYAVMVGIDPTGGTDWRSNSIVWSEPNRTLDEWVQLSVSARAQGGTVTVYLRGEAEWPVKHNDAYFDDICLTYVAPTAVPTNTPRPTDTPTPTSEPTATATPEATATATAAPTEAPATLLISAYEDANGNRRRDEGEPLLAGVSVEIANEDGESLLSYTTDGASEPYAFEVHPGLYQVSTADTPGFGSTSPAALTVQVGSGETVQVGFGKQPVPTATPTETAEPTAAATETPGPTQPTAQPTASQPEETSGRSLMSISGILLAVLALLLPVGLRFFRARV
jgi:hypothetical protein